MPVLTYSEGPGRTLGHAKALVAVGGEPDTIVRNFVARLNADETARENGWWSPTVWRDDHRTAENWLSGSGFAGDLDWGHYEVTPAENGKVKRKFVSWTAGPSSGASGSASSGRGSPSRTRTSRASTGSSGTNA